MNKKEFIEICKRVYDKGLSPGYSGNASMRKGNNILITPTGISFNDLTDKNLVEMDFEAKSFNPKFKPSSEKLMHIEIYKQRKDISVILHTHSVFTSVFAQKGMGIKNLNLVEMKYIFNNEIPVVEYYPPGSAELAKVASEALKDNNIAILKNHGVIVISKDMKDALYQLETVEYLAKVAAFSMK